MDTSTRLESAHSSEASEHTSLKLDEHFRVYDAAHDSLRPLGVAVWISFLFIAGCFAAMFCGARPQVVKLLVLADAFLSVGAVWVGDGVIGWWHFRQLATGGAGRLPADALADAEALCSGPSSGLEERTTPAQREWICARARTFPGTVGALLDASTSSV